MDSAILNLLIENAISPDADASDLTMTLSSKRLNAEEAEKVLLAVCKADIFKAATAVHSILGGTKEKYVNFVYEILLSRCENPALLTKAELLAILAYNDYNLFCRVISYVSPEKIKDTFYKISTTNACRFMRMCIDFGDAHLIELCENEFFALLGSFDSRGCDELSTLLPKLTFHGCANIVSRLLDFFTPAQLSRLYGEGFGDGLRDLITSGYESPAIWDAFFYDFFSKPHSAEELLTEGLWFLQLNATDESAVASCFFLYAIKTLSLNHPIFHYIEGFEYPKAFTRKHTIAYEEEIKKLWSTPKDLVKFLDKTKLCNPFAGADVDEKEKLHIREEGIFSPADYDLLGELFENNVSCEEIITIFLNTFLKKRLVMEELLYISETFNRLDEMLSSLKNVYFEGFIEKYNLGDLVISPKEYYCKQLHVVVVNALEFKYFNEKNENDPKHSKDTRAVAQYHINNFISGQLYITLELPESVGKEAAAQKSWEEIVTNFEEILTHQEIGEKDKRSLKNAFDFSESLFVEEYDFDLFTAAICGHSEKLTDVLEILKTAGWNETFRHSHVRIDSHFYTDFEKYRGPAIKMFKQLISEGQSYDDILTLYFDSIYKLIVPLQILLIISEKEKVLDALSRRIIYCNMPMKDKRVQCRPMTIACAPICTMIDADNFIYNKVPARCVDYTMGDGYIERIIFENAATGVFDTRERGNWFGYIAANMQLHSTKKSFIPRLPDATEYDIREMVFILDCMEAAIILRKNSKEDLNQLIDAMGVKNPFAFREDTRLEINYLSKFLDKKKTAGNKSAMSVVILSADNIGEIAKLYLNTNFKYYLTVSELISLIRNRRQDLFEKIDDLFSNISFECAVDNEGYLWSPFINQNTLKVSGEYCGYSVLCRIYYEAGSLKAEVTSVQRKASPLNAILPALMIGYSLNDSIVPIIKNLLVKNASLTEEELRNVLNDKHSLIVKAVKLIDPKKNPLLIKKSNSDRVKTALSAAVNAISEPDFDLQKLKNATFHMIKDNCDYASVYEMENALACITQLLMQRFCREEEVVFTFLNYIFPSYSFFYRDNGIVDVWEKQLIGFFGEDATAEFIQNIKSGERYLKNKKVF